MTSEHLEIQLEQLRLERILDLRTAIAEGEYSVPADQLAEAMLRQGRRLTPRTSIDVNNPLLN
jgi:anti-sigma28 factor (negative regulator of flagellin synthesis)